MFRLHAVRSWVLVVLVAGLLAAMVTAIHGRGPWYDEFFTYYVTRPGIGLATLLPMWWHDNHPPLFYALAWGTNGLGASFAQRRLINLAFAVLGGAFLFILCRARPALRPLAVPYVMGLASYLPMIDRVDELRNNFLAYITASLAVAALTELAQPNQSPRSRRAMICLAGVLMLAFLVHLAETIIIGAIGAAFGLRLLLMRDWRGAKELALAGGVAILPFAGMMLVQLGAISHNTRNFWITPGLSGARWAIESEIITNLAANWPLTLAGIAGLAILCVRAARERHLSAPLGTAMTLGAGLCLAIAALIALHLLRPFLISRYLVSLDPLIGMIMAIGVAALIARAGALAGILIDMAMLLGALFALHAHTRFTLAQPSWDGTGAAIARIVSACPGTIVHAEMSWNALNRAMPPQENFAVYPYAYHWVAASHGFPLAPPESREMARHCPTLFWTEHVAGEHPTPAAIHDRLRRLGFPVEQGALQRIGNGWIYIALPSYLMPPAGKG